MSKGMSIEQYEKLVEELNRCDKSVGLDYLGFDREAIEEVLKEFNYELIEKDTGEIFFTDGDYAYQVFEASLGKL
ncbi:hypothetical protein ACQUY5_33010, partial [Bacillus cereus]|uniref:hypothetical protein n=1 Tax=Bacillus cereus TaxID=1396 RepID=UPI003D17F3C5